MNPKHWRGMKLLGSALYALGDLPAARTALEFALQLKPDYADAHCDLGNILCHEFLQPLFPVPPARSTAVVLWNL
jgi:cytochrome c-type biogenesis protein CcmH/NrfG